MIDIHSHLLYGIDDGCKTITDSISIIRNAKEKGITDIILTPHYIKNSIYNSNKLNNTKLLNNLKNELSKNDIDVNLYLGNEIYIDEDIIKLLNQHKATTLNNTRYILIELPLDNKSVIVDEVLNLLNRNKLIPVIAHPERYISYYKDFDFFEYLIDNNCLLQANIGSYFGQYGKHVKEMVEGLTKRGMITFVASDIHDQKAGTYDYDINKQLMKLLKDQKKVDDLLINNPSKVLKGKIIK